MEPTRDSTSVMFDLIFEALRREDPRLNNLAMQVISASGKDAVHTLVIEALGSKRSKYRVRLLRIIAEIGEISDPNDQLTLLNLTRDRNLEVRNATSDAFYAVGPHGARERARLEALAQAACEDPDVDVQIDDQA